VDNKRLIVLFPKSSVWAACVTLHWGDSGENKLSTWSAWLTDCTYRGCRFAMCLSLLHIGQFSCPCGNKLSEPSGHVNKESKRSRPRPLVHRAWGRLAYGGDAVARYGPTPVARPSVRAPATTLAAGTGADARFRF